MTNLTELVKALIAGVVTGAVFGWLRLPLPVPSALAGVVGIFGILIGFLLFKRIR